jgi:sulfite reductase beta subunit-like hemoprotein
VPDALHLLADIRLTTREACYNTVRNVTACPLAGVHAREAFDMSNPAPGGWRSPSRTRN